MRLLRPSALEAPGGAVKVAVADGFVHVERRDGKGGIGLGIGSFVKVGYGAGHFEDAAVGACAHVEAEHGLFQYFHRFGGGCGPTVELTGVHLCVAVGVRLGGKALGLYFSCADHALAYVGRAFARLHGLQFGKRHRQDFHLQVDAVEQGA